jgi:flagellar basal-body rod protein FlgC
MFRVELNGVPAMMSALPIALSGLQAQTSRVSASAANLAGQGVRGALPDAAGTVPAGQPTVYQAVTSVDSALGSGGVRGSLQTASPAYLAQFEPDATYADASGMVAAPNVDEGRELVTMMNARQAYKANLAVARTTDEMLGSLLKIKA